MTNLDIYLTTYKKHMKAVRIEKPEYYAWPMDQLDIVAQRMCEAITKGNYNKDSLAFRRTCKELGLKHTYKAIGAFIKVQPSNMAKLLDFAAAYDKRGAI